MFIALEGIDGSGHTTQSLELSNAFNFLGRSNYVTAEPTNFESGSLLRRFLRGEMPNFEKFSETMALLFAADRLMHYELVIKPKLEQNIDVICDRYTLSSLVYQGISVDEAWIKAVNYFVPMPDLTIIIDTPVLETVNRRKLRGNSQEIYENESLQDKIRERYLKLSSLFSAIVVSGKGAKHEVTLRLLKAIFNRAQFEDNRHFKPDF